ncbi:allergen Tha p 1-like [Aricia agestis]|nr:allergen Tha p 1-like [Aricia agestis]
MKFIIVLATVLAAAVAIPADTYNPKYDNFNAVELSENTRLLKSYGKCFLGEGPCTAEGADFKKIIPEALKTKCGKCTPKQKELVRIVIQAFQTKLPDVWKQLMEREDPKGEYTQSFNDFLSGKV